MIRIFIFSLVLLATIQSTSHHVHAQISNLGGNDGLNITITPRNPKPFDEVRAEATNYHININSAQITWIVDGQEITSGIGIKSLEGIKVGENGNNTSITAIISAREGLYAEKTINIRPADVDLVWYAESYTPPFYKGKALLGSQSSVLFTAIPHLYGSSAAKIAPELLIYTWKVNGSIQGSLSGTNRQTFLLESNYNLRDKVVSVTVTNQNKTIVAERSITLSFVDPEIIFYEDSPLLGLLTNKNLSGTSPATISDEITITAIPYFFSVNNLRNSSLSHRWTMNGTIINAPDQPSLTFGVDGVLRGISEIGVHIKNTDRILQSAQNKLRIQLNS